MKQVFKKELEEIFAKEIDNISECEQKPFVSVLPLTGAPNWERNHYIGHSGSSPLCKKCRHAIDVIEKRLQEKFELVLESDE